MEKQILDMKKEAAQTKHIHSQEMSDVKNQGTQTKLALSQEIIGLKAEALRQEFMRVCVQTPLDTQRNFQHFHDSL